MKGAINAGNTSAVEFQPRLRLDHCYRTTTKFQRDEDGALLRDEAGYPLPYPHQRAISRQRKATIEERAQGRERSRRKATIEKRAITRMRNKIEKRQNIGDPDCRQSENEDFPLLAVLRRDKLHDYIKVVLLYRQMFALCESEPLKGQAYGAAPGMATEYETRKMKGVEEVDAAAAKGFKGTSVPGEDVVYERRVRQSAGAHAIPAKRHLIASARNDGDPVVGRTETLHIKLNENTLADYIDSKPRLARIRSALGPLLDPFEDAVLGGRTLGMIGTEAGFNGKAAETAGKALVLSAIAVVDGFLGHRKYVPANDNYLITRKKTA